jgi:3-hydroxyisobutyrate dehydrogenase-like beta-hydroxyacid dehydrogenase
MIGGAVATRLAQTNWPLAVYDVRDGDSDTLPGLPPQLESAREVAECSDVVMIAVVTAEQAEDALIGDGGLLTGDHGELTVVLLSTVTLQAVHRLDRLCRERGAALLDAGVTSGGGRAAEDGLVMMRELSLFLHYYADRGNGTAVDAVAEKLIAEGHDVNRPFTTSASDESEELERTC